MPDHSILEGGNSARVGPLKKRAGGARRARASSPVPSAPARGRGRGRDWSRSSDSELLEWRICDLGLRIEGSVVERRLKQLDAELGRRGLFFRPYAWLSTDWFTPDDTTGFAVPFYLAHPRLIRLERAQMLEVEGGSQQECLKVMRHETAHALDNAYRLRRRKRWREVFGSASSPYRSSYTPDPTSRDHVLNLYYWYSQSHPLEDWAETFAVWLRPASGWRTRYAGWPALAKLEFVDELMREIADLRPPVRTRAHEEPLRSVRMTLGEYYQRKRSTYTQESSPAFDGQLGRVFPPADGSPDRPRASTFLRKNRTELVRRVSEVTGQHRYLLDHVVREMMARCKTRDLRLSNGPAEALTDAAVMLTSLSTQFLYGAHPRYHR